MSEAGEKKDGLAAGSEQAGEAAGGQATGGEQVKLANALRFEQAKNQVLLDEVIALEDEIANRSLAEFEGVVSEETREFWREQLLANRDVATTALREMSRFVGGRGDEERGAVAPRAAPSTSSGQSGAGEGLAGQASTRRPLHNRATARPAVRAATGSPVAGSAAGAGAAGETDDRAARIRNRAQEISQLERVPFSAAFRRAEKEVGGR